MAQNRIKKIAIVGAESSGKTWMCEALSAYYKTNWIPEYAREYFNDSDIYNYTLDDLIIIAKKQIELENNGLKTANEFLFCDTTLITLKIWAELEFSHCPKIIEDLLNATHYDYYFITDNQIPWQADPLRQNKHSRDLLFEMNEKEVKKSGVPYSIITGTDEQRLTFALGQLNDSFKN
jgi:NadR type nicotinamide-nucleotide adenylyltransferase